MARGDWLDSGGAATGGPVGGQADRGGREAGVLHPPPEAQVSAIEILPKRGDHTHKSHLESVRMMNMWFNHLDNEGSTPVFECVGKLK